MLQANIKKIGTNIANVLIINAQTTLFFMTTIREVTQYLEKLAPLAHQESYDNAGLIVGNAQTVITNVLLTLDVTEAVIEEAIVRNCNLVVAHHPLIFKGIKKLNGKNYVERCVIKAIKNDVAIYATHTNLDNATNGVNFMIAQQLGLQNVRILAPKKDSLLKLVSFVPVADTQLVLDALHAAGAGEIGNYDRCSFRVEGIGTFRPNEAANPVIGRANRQEEVLENRFELIFPAFLEKPMITALRRAHPYEEVAYYVSALSNENQEVGAGAIGKLAEPLSAQAFLAFLKHEMKLSIVRHTALIKKNIETVAVCGGVGDRKTHD